MRDQRTAPPVLPTVQAQRELSPAQTVRSPLGLEQPQERRVQELARKVPARLPEQGPAALQAQDWQVHRPVQAQEPGRAEGRVPVQPAFPQREPRAPQELPVRRPLQKLREWGLPPLAFPGRGIPGWRLALPEPQALPARKLRVRLHLQPVHREQERRRGQPEFRQPESQARADSGAGSSVGRLPGQSSCRRTG